MSKQQKWQERLKELVFNAHWGYEFEPEIAYLDMVDFISTERSKLLDEVMGVVRKVEQINDSNGRFNACQEILLTLQKMKEEK